MAESAVVAVMEIQEQFATCEICQENFNDCDKSPRNLPCFHTFCLHCLQLIWQKSGESLKCPNCRHLWPVQKSVDATFPRNKVLMNLVEYITLKNKPEQLMCVNCPNSSNATVRCLDCQQYMCDMCTSYHQKFTKQHKTVLISELVNMPQEEFFQQKEMCKQHENIILDFFCGSCSTAICNSCALVSHRDHQISNVKDVYEEKKKHMRTVLRDLQASTETFKERKVKLAEQNSTLDAMQEKLLQDIDDSYERIITKLSDRRKQLKDDVVSNIGKQKADRDAEMNLIVQSEDVNTEHVLRCQQALSFARTVQFIEMSQDLENKTKSLMKGAELFDVPIQEVSVDDTFQQIDKVIEKTAVVYDGIIFQNKEQDAATRKMLLRVDSHPRRYLEVVILSVQYDRNTLPLDCCSISADDALVNTASSAPETQHAAIFKKLCGVTATTVMSEPTCYWQTDVNIQVLQSAELHKLAAEVGICTEEHVDDEVAIRYNKHAWCVSVVSCKKHNSLCLDVRSRGVRLCDSPVSDFQCNSVFNITLGFLLDTHRKSLHVIHVNANKLIHTITDIDVSQSLMPVFGVYNPTDFNVKLRAMSATNLRLHRQLLTLLSSLVQQ